MDHSMTKDKGKPQYDDYRQRSCHLSVVGIHLENMLFSAKLKASEILGIPIGELYISHHGTPEVETWRRFEHPAKPDLWRVSVTVSKIPEEHQEDAPEPITVEPNEDGVVISIDQPRKETRQRSPRKPRGGRGE